MVFAYPGLPPAMKLTRILVFLVNIHRVYAFYKISKTALTIFLYAPRNILWIALEKVL